jgi:hypothetical protein
MVFDLLPVCHAKDGGARRGSVYRWCRALHGAVGPRLSSVLCGSGQVTSPLWVPVSSFVGSPYPPQHTLYIVFSYLKSGSQLQLACIFSPESSTSQYMVQKATIPLFGASHVWVLCLEKFTHVFGLQSWVCAWVPLSWHLMTQPAACHMVDTESRKKVTFRYPRSLWRSLGKKTSPMHVSPRPSDPSILWRLQFNLGPQATHSVTCVLLLSVSWGPDLKPAPGHGVPETPSSDISIISY